MHISSSKDLASLVRGQRKELDLTLEACAAWCNVGPRFLFDIENAKPSLQLDKILAVTSRLGIRLAAEVRGSVREVVSEAPVVETISAPGFDGADWLTSRAIGHLAAKRCGIPVCEQTFDRNNDRLSISRVGRIEPVVAGRLGQAILREEQGGPGYREIFSAIDARSASPIADVRATLRWACFSYLVADAGVSAADVRLSVDQGVLVPFEVIACASGEVAADRVWRGLRIGREWPDEWLRVDHWIDFAAAARVKPKIVFDIMTELSETVPLAVREAAVMYARSPVLRGAAATIVNTAHARATRMRDLMQSVSHQGLPGLKKQRGRPQEAAHQG